MIHKCQQKQDPPLETLWGLPEPTTLLYLAMSYIESNTTIDNESLTHNLSKSIQNLWESQIKICKMNKSTEIAIAANLSWFFVPHLVSLT